MKKKNKLVYYLIAIPILAIFIFYQINKYGSNCQKFSNDVNSHEFSGVVVKKYYDKKNHDYHTVEYKQADLIVHKLTYPNDRSGLFNFLNKGDSIVKLSGSSKVIVNRKDKAFEFFLDFGCDK